MICGSFTRSLSSDIICIQGQGFAIAQEIWPDSLLSEVPKHLQNDVSSSSPPSHKVSTIPTASDDSLTDTPSRPEEVIEGALFNSEVSKLPYMRAALASALRRFQRIVQGKKS